MLMRTIDIDHYEIAVDVYFYVENDGIGSYEFWGFKSFDLGHNKIVLVDIHTNSKEMPVEAILEDDSNPIHLEIINKIAQDG